MTDIVTRMRLVAEDLHVLNPVSEHVKVLSLGADEIESLRAENEVLRAELRDMCKSLDIVKWHWDGEKFVKGDH